MKFGVREICDVVFKTTANDQKVGNKTFKNKYTPAFFIDTAKTSTMEQASTTVYATGGRGNNRLIAWEGEKTMTFTVEDALISPMGLAVLSGAGLINASNENIRHVHITVDAEVNKGWIKIPFSTLKEETGINDATAFTICGSADPYAIKLDGSGAGIIYYQKVQITEDLPAGVPEGTTTAVTLITGTKDYKFTSETNKETYLYMKILNEDSTTDTNPVNVNGTVKVDFYLLMVSGVQEVIIEPSSFGGYFYVEAQTLFRREDNGQDMAAELIFPKVKVQSGFTFTMASSGDPSTFTFTMDAFPAYTQFDNTKKVNCAIQIIGKEGVDSDDTSAVNHDHSLSFPTE